MTQINSLENTNDVIIDSVLNIRRKKNVAGFTHKIFAQNTIDFMSCLKSSWQSLRQSVPVIRKTNN